MDQSPEQDERARRRDERERDLMGHLALIAPSPELLREVVALTIDKEGAAPPDAATGTDEPVATVSSR